MCVINVLKPPKGCLCHFDGKETGWQTICPGYHRINEESCVNCNVSDTELSKSLKEGKQYVIYKCLNGMIDVATPINIGGKHMANLFTGQFLSQEPDEDYFIAQVKKYGFACC
ncbi:MAG: PocR ligand-binding domain-containing protein [Candidatus Anammoxibacter sp.]